MSKKKDKTVSNQFDSQKMLLSTNSSFPVQEAFKMLRSNVMFSLPGGDCKIIGITSANRGEGKSVVSINLAMSLAQLDKRVLLIDCDLRIPTVASKLGISNDVGLCNYLAGTESDNVLRVFHQKNPQFDTVVAGRIPPDPTALLSSETMKSLLTALRADYDFIILDFPPISLVTDAVLLADSVDGYLIVVRHNSSEYSKLNETITHLDFAKANILGFIYNAKMPDGLINKSSYYYKNYRAYK